MICRNCGQPMTPGIHDNGWRTCFITNTMSWRERDAHLMSGLRLTAQAASPNDLVLVLQRIELELR